MSVHHPDMTWIMADVRDLSAFDDCSFDVVIDKGLIDLIHCYPGLESVNATSKTALEAHRVLANDGQYISLSNLNVGVLCEIIGITSTAERSIDQLQQQAMVTGTFDTKTCNIDQLTIQDACWRASFVTSSTDDSAVTVCVARKMADSEELMEIWCKLKFENTSLLQHPASSDDDFDNEIEDMKDIFRGLYNSNPDILSKYMNIEYWEGLSDGLHMSQNPLSTMPPLPKRPRWSNEADIQRMAASGKLNTKPEPEEYYENIQCLQRSGYFLMDSEHIGWDEKGEQGVRSGEGRVPFDRLVRTVERLVENGWPSCFALLYDEYWHIIYELYDIMGPFLEEKGDDLVLEMDCFVWALQRQKDLYSDGNMTWGDAQNNIGGNFGTPHRDADFDDCNTPDGKPEKLSVWVPLTACTNDNGCMYVIPKEADPLFSDIEHKFHMSASRATADGTLCRFDVSRARPLICPRGSINSWQGNLIHWGSSCGAFAKQPRMSIAMTLRKPDTDDEQSNNVCGRKPLKREELNDLTPTARFSIVGKAIIMYSHWFSVLKMDYHKMRRGVVGMKAPKY